jgi:short subunit dehydrogenase-like uncharacterized protein
MPTPLLLYGANGYVGEACARAAVAMGLSPILAGRNAVALTALGRALGLEVRVAALDDPAALDAALAGCSAVLHAAGPYVHTWRPMVDACLRTGAHYLDITGELPVFEAVAARDAEARARGVMLLPGAGFDVVPTDCLARQLHERLPSATHLTLAFQSVGPGGLPPGTQRTAIELLAYGNRVREDGQLRRPTVPMKTRLIDFGQGPVRATQLTWGDVFTAWHTTGIPNIEDYTVFPAAVGKQLALMQRLRPLLALPFMRALLKRGVRPGPSAARRAQTVTHVWGEARDARTGATVAARLHGPEAGVEWTVACMLAVAKRVLAGDAPAGYQTPATAYGGGFVLEVPGVTREVL